MEKSEIWPTIHTERAALAADLESLNEPGWDTPSLCEGWSVRDVLAHMTGTAKISPGSFFGKIITNGFSLKKLQQHDIAELRGGTPGDTLANFKAELNSSKHPPGPTDTWLGEVIVHSEDIRRPLGIKHEYPAEALTRVADFYKGSNLVIGTKKRIEGLHLKATDVEWSYGDGPEVSGPMAALVVAMAGRKEAIADLSGEGVTTLTSRG
jgi:uncharacterized protein (TIGR03083 family)